MQCNYQLEVEGFVEESKRRLIHNVILEMLYVRGATAHVTQTLPCMECFVGPTVISRHKLGQGQFVHCYNYVHVHRI